MRGLRSIGWKHTALALAFGMLVLAGCFQLTFEQYLEDLLAASGRPPQVFDPGTLAVRIINNASTKVRMSWAAVDSASSALSPTSGEFVCTSNLDFCCNANSICDVVYGTCPAQITLLQMTFVDSSGNEVGGQDFTVNPDGATYDASFYTCGSVLILRVNNPPPTSEVLPL